MGLAVRRIPGSIRAAGVLLVLSSAARAQQAATADPASHWLLPYGGALILMALVALALFHVLKGPLGAAGNDGPPAIERFTPLERALHWTNAMVFVLMATTGIVMAFGRFVLPPGLAQPLSEALKLIHSFAGPLFAASLMLVLITFLGDNIASAADWRWLTRLGGLFGGAPVPAHRFNAGQKGMYWWGMFLPGLVAVGSGLVLDGLIADWGETEGEMRIVHTIHLGAALIMIAMLAGHIYMGTIGVRGAHRAMRDGWVDAAWAREHHGLWHEDVVAGHIPARRSGTGPEAASAADATPADKH